MNMPALTTAQMVEVDRLMIEACGITLEQMMENAGRNLAELARKWLGGRVKDQYVSVLCGPGNNGGGGMVAARHLHNMGARVSVHLAGDTPKLKDVPAHQWAILQALQLDRAQFELESAALILDAMLGYGASGDPRPPIKDWIERANGLGIAVLSLDCPSGLDATTGQPGRPCIRAEATMTLALPKTGLLASQANDYVGRLFMADIGVPPELYRRIGMEVGPIFAEEPIVELDELDLR
jgi:NAD(P)H-hydrate epimerase